MLCDALLAFPPLGPTPHTSAESTVSTPHHLAENPQSPDLLSLPLMPSGLDSLPPPVEMSLISAAQWRYGIAAVESSRYKHQWPQQPSAKLRRLLDKSGGVKSCWISITKRSYSQIHHMLLNLDHYIVYSKTVEERTKNHDRASELQFFLMRFFEAIEWALRKYCTAYRLCSKSRPSFLATAFLMRFWKHLISATNVYTYCKVCRLCFPTVGTRYGSIWF